MDGDLVLLLVLIVLSGAFSGAETALTSLGSAKVRTLQGDGKFASGAIVKLKQRPHNTLITILIGNNVVNILATVIATLWATRAFGDNVIGIVTGGLTFVLLIFGEITPKTFAQKYAVPFSRLLAYPLLYVSYVLFPIIWLIEKFIQGLMKLLKAHHPISSVSEEELLAMVSIGKEEGVIEEHEHELIENVLEFTDTTAEEIMTPRKDIDCLEISTTVADAVHFFVNSSHSRIPVYKGNLDNVVGILTVHDLLKILHLPGRTTTLADLSYAPPIVIPKTKPISKLFHEFKRRRKHLALVVDEHGMTDGLVTMEDILEEIVGDIVDEQDREKSPLTKLDNNTWESSADATIEEVNEALDVELDYAEHETIALLILEKLGRFPKVGEKIQFEGLLIQVMDMGKKKIEKVKLTKLERKDREESSENETK